MLCLSNREKPLGSNQYVEWFSNRSHQMVLIDWIYQVAFFDMTWNCFKVSRSIYVRKASSILFFRSNIIWEKEYSSSQGIIAPTLIIVLCHTFDTIRIKVYTGFPCNCYRYSTLRTAVEFSETCHLPGTLNTSQGNPTPWEMLSFALSFAPRRQGAKYEETHSTTRTFWKVNQG